MSSPLTSAQKALIREEIHAVVVLYHRLGVGASGARQFVIQMYSIEPLVPEVHLFIVKAVEASIAEVYAGWSMPAVQLRMQEVLASLGYARYGN